MWKISLTNDLDDSLNCLGINSIFGDLDTYISSFEVFTDLYNSFLPEAGIKKPSLSASLELICIEHSPYVSKLVQFFKLMK